MKPLAQVFLALAVIVAAAAVIALLIAFRPQAEDAGARETPPPVVEFVAAQTGEVPTIVRSQGILDAVTRTVLSSEVSGRIVEVSPALRSGTTVQPGDLLLRIEPTDYLAALESARSTAAEAALSLAQVRAEATKAARDWERLGDGEPATPLVLRQPHVRSAEARAVASEAAEKKAALDLARTEVRAPYHGRIVRREAQPGSFVAVGSPLGELYALETFEVRLPVSIDEFSRIDIDARPSVRLSALIAGREHSWEARVVRAEAAVDRQSRSVHLVAELPAIPSPPRPGSDRFLKPGLFLEAEVAGSVIDNVIRVPRRAIAQGNQAVIIDEEDRIRTREVTIAYADADRVYVSEGLDPGDRVCVTVLAEVIVGTPVRATAAADEEEGAD